MPVLNKPFSDFLNASRWLAAFLVVIAHARHLLLVEYKSVLAPTLPIKGIYFITGFGHEAVVIFFVISGFLVGGLTLRKWRSAGVDLLQYGVARVSRIYTVLVPALILGGLLDWVGLHLFNASALYTESPRYQSSMNSVIADNLGFDTFAGNLFMLEGIVVHAFGSNAPLWSLVYEWWYYCIFALVGAAFLSRGKRQLGVALCALLLAVFLPGRLLLWMSIWLLGILAALWIESGKKLPRPLVGFIIFAVVLTISRLSHDVEATEPDGALFSGYWRDMLLGLAYMVCLAGASRLRSTFVLSHAQRLLAEFSYSTYLFHFPVMVLVVAVAYQYAGLSIQVQPTWANIIWMAGITGLVYPCCYVFSLVFERHTNIVRQHMMLHIRSWR
jgi:peptidoglycan/LPS O-acetylase OafA/YrhL